METSLDRAPEVLDLLARGVGDDYGSCATIRGRFGPTRIRSRERGEAFRSIERTPDLMQVAGLVCSLLAVLLASDAISGEREQGTLQLLLSQALPRYTVLLGEYVGALVAVAIPLLLCWGTVLLTLATVTGMGLDAHSALGLGLLATASGLATAFFVAAGLFVSCRTSSSATSTAVAFLLWVLVVVVYPAAIPSLVAYLRPVQELADITATDVMDRMSYDASKQHAAVVDPRERAQNLQHRFDQADLASRLAYGSPYASYVAAAESLAGTDLAEHRRFVRQAAELEQALRAWQTQKISRYPDRERTYNYGDGPLDLEGLPEAGWLPERADGRLIRAVGPLAWLLVLDLSALAASIIAFGQYDPRFR